MAQICAKCSFANPPDATYCYNDGALLEGHTAQRGGLTRGSQPFPSQFVFPSGQVCGNFDQLAMACQNHWAEAVDLLRQGYLASFLGGLGRVDLAVAAQEAARFPDTDRGLDQLLAKLPSQVLEPPKLRAEPTDVNLGIVPMGADRRFDLHLTNLGGRLLYGSVVSDSKWLTLGEAPGTPQKLFQFRDEAMVPVQIRGQHLRAGNKPLEAQLLIDSNGGQVTLRVRLEVPVKAFPRGVLAGATVPREVAVKAKQAPKEAALLFEDGSVSQWYKDNGWIYPVQAPTASGLGAVQQFFEALGLATAPKVEVAEKAIHFHGYVGQPLQHMLEVRTPEKRPIWAWGVSDQPWLDVGRANLNGRIATLPINVPSVPQRPGETLQATVNVTANGNQRFAVPVSLTITGAASPFAFEATPVEAMPVAAVPVAAVPVAAVPLTAEIVQAVPVTAEPFAFSAAPAPTATAVPFPSAAPAPVIVARPRRQANPVWWHLLPAGLLVLALIGTIVRDIFIGGGAGDNLPVDPHPRIRLAFDEGQNSGNSLRFGLVVLDPANPRAADPKRLTFSPTGLTNSTVVRIDGRDRVFGKDGGRWDPARPEKIGSWGGLKATWVFDEQVAVTQTVELIPGEPQIVNGDYKHLVDTCLIRYTIENRDNRMHVVGLRFLLDTLIGSNDGVPFTVPGQGDVDTSADYKGAQVPDFIFVLEREPKDPGTVAQLNLRLGGKLEAPDRVSLTHWPGYERLSFFDVPVLPMATPVEKDQGRGDSAVALYWDERELGSHKIREVGFTYGLGSLSTTAAGQLALTVGGAFVVGNELTVVGLVANPGPGETVSLDLLNKEGQPLKAGLAFLDAAKQTQIVPPPLGPRPSPVTWRIQASQAGDYILRIHTSTGAVQERRITIKARSIF
jgi:hypothetical protein